MAEGWQCSTGRFDKRVKYGAAEARPELLGLFHRRSRNNGWRRRRENLERFDLGIGRKVDMGDQGGSKVERGGVGDDEYASEAGYLTQGKTRQN